MNSVISAIEKLFPELTKNRKLALAWSVFIVAVGWVIFFAQSYSSEKAKFDRFMVETDALLADFDNTMVVYDVISPQIVEAIEVRIFFMENFSGSKYPYDKVAPELVIQGYKQVTEVLSGIASARGVINSANFSMEELNEYKEGFSQDLTLMETYLKDYEMFYSELIRNNPREALNISANFPSSNAVESVNGFQSRLRNFSKESEIEIRKRLVDMEEKTNEISLFNFKKFLTWIASIYILIFIPSAIVYQRRIRLKLQGKKAQKRSKLNEKKKSQAQKTG